METDIREIEAIYAGLWQQSADLFRAGRCEPDPLIRRADDSRRGLSVIVRPNPETASGIEAFLDAARQIEPQQYFYPRNDFHMTALSIVSCREHFQRNPDRDAAYMSIIDGCLRKIGPPQIRFRGITASPACVMIQGFPQNGYLRELRKHLRTEFKQSGLENSIDSRYPIKTAHLTVLRFQEPLRRAPEFVRLLEQYRKHDFGTQAFRRFEFVSNDWYLRENKTRILGDFTLSSDQETGQVL
jgi:2'-5' RNA ligase